MPQPTMSEVHVNTALTDYSDARMLMPSAFVWRNVFPVIPTRHQSDVYHIYTKADLLRSDAQKRAPGNEAAVRDYGMSTDTFFCDDYAIAIDVPEERIANADPVIDPEEDAAAIALQDINLQLDVQWAATFFAASIWGTTVTGGTDFTVWSDATADPIKDVHTGIKTVLQNTGRKPNTLVLGAAAWYDGLAHNEDIVDRLPDNAPRVPRPEFLANLFGVDRVFISESVRNTAQEGLAASYSFVSGAHALLVHVEGPSPRSAAAGGAFVWTAPPGGAGESGIRTSRIDMPTNKAVRIQQDMYVDFKVTGSDLGYFLASVA